MDYSSVQNIVPCHLDLSPVHADLQTNGERFKPKCSADTVNRLIQLKQRYYLYLFNSQRGKYSINTVSRCFITVYAIELSTNMIGTDVWGVLATLF
jgi:hypothetical protein